jgi:hypothetical protein
MPDEDSENVSDNPKSSMSVSVLSSIDNASIEHAGVLDVNKKSGSDCDNELINDGVM